MKHRPPPSKQNFNESTIIEFSKKYKQLATNMVFPRISSIFDLQAIFSIELLPGGGQANHKMDFILTPTFIGSRCRISGARLHPAKQSTLTWKLAREKWD